MKKHLVSIWFDIGNKKSYSFKGFVTGKEINGKLLVSPGKIFKKAFGFELPDYSKITIL